MSKAKNATSEIEPQDLNPNITTPIGTLLRKNIISALGQPPELVEVAVRTLWGDKYRVNVLTGLTGLGISTVKIAHSYFVTANNQGAILTSEPSIKKLYA